MTAVYEDSTGNFLGHDPNEGCEHRTVGSHRAWCFECGEWCYPKNPCARCFRAIGEQEKKVTSRILRNSDGTIDEVVVENCMVHLEQLDDDRYYLAIYPKGAPVEDRAMFDLVAENASPRSRKKVMTVTAIEELVWDEDKTHAVLDQDPSEAGS